MLNLSLWLMLTPLEPEENLSIRASGVASKGMDSSSEVSDPAATNLKQSRNPKLIGPAHYSQRGSSAEYPFVDSCRAAIAFVCLGFDRTAWCPRRSTRSTNHHDVLAKDPASPYGWGPHAFLAEGEAERSQNSSIGSLRFRPTSWNRHW